MKLSPTSFVFGTFALLVAIALVHFGDPVPAAGAQSPAHNILTK